MARPKNPIPQARKHSSGQSRVTIDGKDYLLGKHGSPEAGIAYCRLIAEWQAKTGPFAPTDEDPITILELTAGYWLYAEKYYGYDKNPRRGDCFNLKDIIGIVNRLYGSLPAAQFGPLDMKAVIGEMVRVGWARSYVNHSIGKVKRIFKWGTQEEMIPANVWHSLLAVNGLKRGRTEAPDNDPVKPIDLEDVLKTKEHLRPALRAMVDFCLLTGCRPAEACSLRRDEIDQSNPACWIFRPEHHKTSHHGHKRLILIGPKAQVVIADYLDGCGPEEYVFSPRREEEGRLTERHANRKSPMTPSQTARMERARLRIRARHPKNCYTTSSLRKAIHRACDLAGITVWGPNRLRHTRATELREHGLDNVGTILGHSKLETTQIYSERNLKAAMELVSKVG